jgi:Carboxypeptidase regulatory-like domain
MCLRTPLFLAALLGAGAASLFAQATAVVQISGTVADDKGGVIGGARVKAIHTDTGLVRSATTESNGAYVLSNLPVGPYRLEAVADGFRTYVQTGIVLQVNTNPVINIVLQIGSLSQEIQVSADATMVEAQSNGISQVIDQRRVVDLPLNGRQETQLILLSGAAVPAPSSDMASSKNYPSSTTISVGGGQANGTYYLLDGGDHNDAFGTINLPLPFPDVLQEFSVQTNAIPASYGVRAGAVVNIVSKSGTNELHGDLFEFLRTGVTNARNFFAARRDNLKRNQFGGTAGAPIVKNKVFVFGGYQGTRLRTAPPTSTVFVPTPAALRGDFSTLESACGKSRALTDPTTGQPFPNNFIDPSRFNPQALAFLKYVPVPTDPCGKVLFGVPNNSSEDQFLTRGDWIHNARHSVFGRYYFADWRNPGAYDGKNLLLTTRPGVLDRAQALTLGDTYSFSGAAINAFHFTWSRDRVTRGPAGGLPTAADIGLNVAPSPGNFPQIVVSNDFNTFCGTCSLAHVNTTSLQIADDFNRIIGRHQITFGGEWIRRVLDFQVSTQQNPEFDFNGQFTNDPLADLLLGRDNQFIQGNLTKMNELQHYIAFYAQDKIRLGPRFSVNAGLRWEPYFPVYDVFGRATHLDIGAFLAGRKTTKFQNAPPGLFFPGDPGMPNAGTHRHLADFAPRLGLVWDPKGDGRTTIRAAYGILYDITPMQQYDRFGFGPPWASTVTILSPPGGFADPFLGYPGGNPFPQPSPPPSSAVFVAAGQYVNLPLYARPTYMQQWNLSVQRQVGDAWLLTANYLGNHSAHRWISTAINPAVYIPGSSNTSNTNQRRILALANPVEGAKFGPVAQIDDGAVAGYNALLVSANHRLSRNFSMLLNYTWSHCISDGDAASEIGGGYQNPNYRTGDRGNCVVDIRQIFNASVVALSPRFSGSWTQRIFGNWESSAIVTKRTGFWFNTGAGRDNSLTGIGADRPDVIGDSHVSNPSLDQWFNPAAFRSNALGAFGNSGRNNLQGPGAFTFDMALLRRFSITERHRVEARAEAFNILNHPVFNNPRSSLTDANIGRILSANDPRIFQFALKYIF